MDEALKARILEVLDSQHLMALATVRPDGFPQTTWVNYIHDDLTLYFATDAASQKVGNIHLCNKVSLTIAAETQNFYKLRGLSMAGTATRILASDQAHEIALDLFRRIPQSRRFVPKDPLSLAVVAIRPVAISYIDYSEGFGTSHLVEL
jgi:nitroimidazol reductase NimA-like FMN-containing flavoprotein (pyridoxamine 5'-phosphate oxidase superfamily)